MNRRLSAFFAAVPLLIGLITLPSCAARRSPSVERETLFRLDYGRFEDEIDLFNLEGNSGGPDTQIYMRDGMLYVVNPGSQKVLQFTSFGDLLSVFYNPESNPAPSFANTLNPAVTAGEGATSTRKAVAHPFNSPGFLAVDSRKRLFVVDRMPVERQEYDNTNQVILNSVVLRFAPDGRFMDYLGQEGAGGTPFPPIAGVYVNSANQLIIVSKHQGGSQVYWFSEEGLPLYRIPLLSESLPSPYDSGSAVYATLDKVLPDPDSLRLYLKIDYYVPNIDQATGSNAGINFDRSCVYPLEIFSGLYQNYIDIPSYQGVEKDNLGTLTFIKPYELIGVTSSGWFFLSTPVAGGYALELLDSRFKRIQKRFLEIRKEELMYNALMVSPDGIISALLATANSASLVWWRTDSLIGEIRR